MESKNNNYSEENFIINKSQKITFEKDDWEKVATTWTISKKSNDKNWINSFVKVGNLNNVDYTQMDIKFKSRDSVLAFVRKDVDCADFEKIAE